MGLSLGWFFSAGTTLHSCWICSGQTQGILLEKTLRTKVIKSSQSILGLSLNMSGGHHLPHVIRRRLLILSLLLNALL